jgi:predicted dehydrogenase
MVRSAPEACVAEQTDQADVSSSLEDSMQTLSVGVVGAGDIAHKVHLPVLLSMPNVHVEWIHDANVARGRSVASAHGLRAVDASSPADLPSCDIALLAIPVGVRAAYYEAFAKRGTGVLAEKPFAVSVDHHQSLTDMYEPHTLGCGYMRRFYSSTQIFRHLIQRGTFGPLRRIVISEGNRSTASRVDRSYIDDPRQSSFGGILSELGCHSLDVALYVTGARGYEVRSCQFDMDGAVDRKVTATIRLTDSSHLPKEGVSVEYCVSWLDRQDNRIALEFENSTVWAEVGPSSEVHMGTIEYASTAMTLVPATRGAMTTNQAFFLQWQAFGEGFCSKTESEVSARSALLGTSLIEALYKRGRSSA